MDESKRKVALIVRWILLILSAILIVLYLAPFFELAASQPPEGFESSSYQPYPTDQYILSAIEGNASIKLPPSATEIYEYTTGFRDISVWVRFNINPSELEGFLETTLCDQPLTIDDPQAHESYDYMPWWNLNKAQHLETCNVALEPDHQQIWVDWSDPNSFIIYVANSVY